MRLGPLLLAGLVLAVMAFRRRRLSSQARIVGLVLVGALVLYGSGVVHLPNLEHALRQVGQALGPYTYLLVGALAFLETGLGVGLIAPGELAVVVGGVAAGQGHIQIAVLILVVWACAFAGDTTSFLLGRRFGREFLLRNAPRLRLTTERIEQVERYYANHGGKTILIGRFIGFVRPLSPFIAGTTRMAPRRFFAYSFLAAGAWSASFSILGYVSWQSFDRAAAIAEKGSLALAAVIALLVAAVLGYRTLRARREPRTAP
ncbi:MAG TPA: DedA family protein [Solirubrobacteraceae bacterium]|nr:DedA family protein [Solirubrobacteraceae bacterium]